MNVLLRVFLSFLLVSVFFCCGSYFYGLWLIKNGYPYIGHWYIANGMFWKRDIAKHCPYHDDEVCPCWNCPNYNRCPHAD